MITKPGKHLLVFALLLLAINLLKAQDDPDNIMDELLSEQDSYTSATFKSTRIINGHSIEQPSKNNLEFRISHRFGRINDGAYEWFGLDQSTIHFSFEYSILDRLTIAYGRSSYNKTYDAYVKYQIFRQSNGGGGSPVHLTYFTSAEYVSLKNEIPDYNNVHRLSYVHQLLIARKINKRLSLQLSPTYIHKNLVSTAKDKNDILSLGAGGRFKITQHLSFNAEIFLLDPGETTGGTEYQMPLSFGIDLETGGHVFQIMVTNAQAMREVGFITETTGDWSKGEVHLGFNISRTFDF